LSHPVVTVYMKSKFKFVYTTLAVVLATLGSCAAQGDRAAETAIPTNANAQAATTSSDTRVQETVQQLMQFGPRVAGTSATEQASQYLIEEYRKAGYETEIQTFTYPKFRDLGSTVTVNGQTIAGQAMNNSITGQVTARVVVVSNVGRPEDFTKLDVKGAIAVVRRGEIPFSQKAENAANAGVIALIVVNTQNTPLRGTLGSPAKIPVLGLSSSEGEQFLNSRSVLNATLNVNTQQQTVTGRNVIAHLPGVTQPRLILGGHYDSVVGSPGANDNASGTAVVLETARQLANTPSARQIWFMAFDGEEDGLQGSRYFVNSVQPQFLSSLRAMFNFDMVGINDRLLIGGSPELRAQVKQQDANTLDSLSGSSDHASFAAKGVPVLFFYRGSDPNYHSPGDRITTSRALNDTIQTALEAVEQVL